MLAHGHHVPNCCARIAACYEGLAHEDGVGTGSGVVDNVLRPSHTRLRHADDVILDERRPFGGALLGVLDAALPLEHRPAAVAILGELAEDRAEVDLAIAAQKALGEKGVDALPMFGAVGVVVGRKYYVFNSCLRLSLKRWGRFLLRTRSGARLLLQLGFVDDAVLRHRLDLQALERDVLAAHHAHGWKLPVAGQADPPPAGWPDRRHRAAPRSGRG